MKISACLWFCLPAACVFQLSCRVNPAQAVEQFTQRQCLQLQHELDDNRERQRRGYKLKETEGIKTTELRLEQQLFYHCNQPIQPAKQHSQGAMRRIKSSMRLIKPLDSSRSAGFFSTAIAIKAPYQGKQLSAWLGYYQEPRFCYGVRSTSVIVECANRRQQAMAQFEQDWQQQHASHLSDQQPE